MRLSFDYFNRKMGVIFFIAATLHYPIAFYLVDGLYLGFYCLSIVPLILVGLSSNILKKKENVYFYCYFFIILISVLLSSLVVPPNNLMKASMGYIFYQLYFFLYTTCVGIRGVISIVKVNTLIAVVSGSLALYQITVDPLLFGLYANTKYENAESWSSLRASSLFYSSQVYAAYMVMSIVAYDIYLSKNKFLDIALIVMLVVLGLFSGSVGFIFGVILYFSMKAFISSPTKFLRFSAIVLTSFYVFTNVLISTDIINKQSPLYRVATFYDDTGDSSGANEQRFKIWDEVIKGNDLVVFGNGIGSASSVVRGDGLITTESYILNLYYEGGFTLIFGFLFLLYGVFSCLKRSILHFQVAFLSVFMFYAVIVHVYYAVNLPIVWLLLFGFATKLNVLGFREVNIRR